MLNPFKKKEDGFSLDDYSLPSLNQQDKSQDNISNLSDQELMDQTPKFQDNNNSPFPNNNNSSSNNFNETSQNSNNSHSQDLAKAKLETIEAKISLMDARMSAMEQKIEMIYQMLALEISDDTKNKLKINSMMDNVKNKKN